MTTALNKLLQTRFVEILLSLRPKAAQEDCVWGEAYKKRSDIDFSLEELKTISHIGMVFIPMRHAKHCQVMPDTETVLGGPVRTKWLKDHPDGVFTDLGNCLLYTSDAADE